MLIFVCVSTGQPEETDVRRGRPVPRCRSVVPPSRHRPPSGQAGRLVEPHSTRHRPPPPSSAPQPNRLLRPRRHRRRPSEQPSRMCRRRRWVPSQPARTLSHQVQPVRWRNVHSQLQPCPPLPSTLLFRPISTHTSSMQRVSHCLRNTSSQPKWRS